MLTLKRNVDKTCLFCRAISFPCLEYVIVNNYYRCYLIVQEKKYRNDWPFNLLKDVLCKKGHVFHAWSIYKHRILLQRLLHEKNKLTKPLCYVSMKTIAGVPGEKP